MEDISVFKDTQLCFQSQSGKQTAPDQTANPTRNISNFWEDLHIIRDNHDKRQRKGEGRQETWNEQVEI